MSPRPLPFALALLLLLTPALPLRADSPTPALSPVAPLQPFLPPAPPAVPPPSPAQVAPGPPGAAPVPSPPTIWSGVILATNNPHPAPVPSQISSFAQKLKNIFGYNQFEILGEHSLRIEAPYEHWLIPSKQFYLSIRSHLHPGNPFKVSLFQNRRRVADFDAHLAPDSPLFIRGPQYNRGQVIIVLHSR